MRRLHILPPFAALLILAACGTGPHLEVPTPGPELYSSLEPVAIHAVSSNEIWVTGSLTRKDGTPEGLILSSETGGRQWRRLGVEVHDLGRVTFQTVHFGDRLRGWVGGIRVDDRGRTRGVVFRTEDGGSHWRETTLVQDPDIAITQVHSMVFTSDVEGAVIASIVDEDGSARETVFVTKDAGRSWTAAQYREDQKVPFRDHSLTMVDLKRGFRLRRARYPGVHLVEATVSEGRDWMPVSELSLAALNTYY